MKYKITNKQLYDLMIRHLNDFKRNHQTYRFESFIELYEKAQDDEPVMSYYSDNKALYIRENVLGAFMTWFPLDKEDSMEFIKNWFEKTYDVKIYYVGTLR